MNSFVPVLPETAPFTPEQRAYLNGFLAGLFSRAQPASGVTPPALPTPALSPLCVLFGSQTGTAEKLARSIAKAAGSRNFAPAIHELSQFTVERLAGESTVLIVTSTYGDGEPPDNARALWQDLTRDNAPSLAGVRYSICALGDTNYPRFCQFGRDLDARLEALGATAVIPRQDCDVDYDQPFQSWLEAALSALSSERPASLAPAPEAVRGGLGMLESPEESPAPGTRKNPFPARLKTNLRLSHPRSAKDVRHFEIDLLDSGICYEPGDALGVWPSQSPELVDALIATLELDPETPVPVGTREPMPFRSALIRHFDISRLPPALLNHFAETSGDSVLRQLIESNGHGDLQTWLQGRDLLDLVQEFPSVRMSATEWVSRLRPLQPRLYSISSSPRAHPREVHLTVSAVRYALRNRERTGVASCFLADRVDAETPVPVFVHSNPAFRMPAPEVPLIMIGPGTGIAPFRAFLEERQHGGNSGRNWLFFGDQHEELDFIYRTEIEEFLRQGVLTRLDLAWSRDQQEKIYVQNRILESARDLYAWLEDGAAIYICGDAKRMARDVDQALRKVLQIAGGKSEDEAEQYLRQLQSQRRYQRDVY